MGCPRRFCCELDHEDEGALQWCFGSSRPSLEAGLATKALNGGEERCP